MGEDFAFTSQLRLAYWMDQLVASKSRCSFIYGSLVGGGHCLCSEVEGVI